LAANAALITALRASFGAHASPTDAVPMQAYMKSAMPFHGIKAPLRRALMRSAVKAWPCTTVAGLIETMRALWRGACHREERYAAMELARVGPHARLMGPRLLPLYESMIVEGAWWDICDDISGEAIGELLQRHPTEVRLVLRRWSHSDNLWLRRASIICQRRPKAGFDAHLLYETILPSIGDSPWAREFFLRKGIGWALRERSRRAPEEVRAFCREYAGQLSSLTRREALRVIDRRKA
jgi:3-methyladenine DNA glycosylase AlkD